MHQKWLIEPPKCFATEPQLLSLKKSSHQGVIDLCDASSAARIDSQKEQHSVVTAMYIGLPYVLGGQVAGDRMV